MGRLKVFFTGVEQTSFILCESAFITVAFIEIFYSTKSELTILLQRFFTITQTNKSLVFHFYSLQ